MSDLAARAANPLEAQSSVLNPADMARNQARGRIRPDMTVREGLELMGIDVDGPMTQLTGGGPVKAQLDNATIGGKIRSAGASPAGTQVPPAAPAGGGLEGLLRGR